jgi:dTDP-glucose pyrophosphorylase
MVGGSRLAYQTLITAAGNSFPEFRAAGFLVPKNLLKPQGGLLINQAVASYKHKVGPLVVALNKEENREFSTSDRVSEAYPEASFVETSSSVQGALATAVLATEGIDLDQPLVIAAGDSIVEGGVEEYISALQAKSVDAGTIVFESTNPRWSYVTVGESGNVLEVVEKQVSGPFATIGCFYFKSAKLFLQAAEWVFVNNAQVNDRFYVSTSLNYLVSEGLSVGYEILDKGKYTSFSTPADCRNLTE